MVMDDDKWLKLARHLRLPNSEGDFQHLAVRDARASVCRQRARGERALLGRSPPSRLRPRPAAARQAHYRTHIAQYESSVLAARQRALLPQPAVAPAAPRRGALSTSDDVECTQACTADELWTERFAAAVAKGA